MNEKFSVSLELALNKWKSQVATVKKSMQDIGKVTKGSIAIDDSSIKNMTAQQEQLKNKILDIQATLQMASQDTKLFSPTEVLEMRAELEKLESQLDGTTQSSTAFKKVGDNISNTMKKGMQSAKKFTLSLFGIHSIYRALSRASSAYLAQDQETSDKIQAAWIGLGSVFAPLLQMIADFAIKAVSYLNVFMKAFMGVDFLGKAMSKSMDKANKSAKGLSKTLAGFDEITNLDSSSGSGISDWTSAFKNVELDPKITKFFENLGKTLAPLKDNLGEIALTLLGVFTGAKLATILLGIGSIGATAFGVGILIAELATAIWLVVYATEEMKKISKINNEVQEQQIDLSKTYTQTMREKLELGTLTEEQVKGMNKTGLDTIDRLNKENEELAKTPTLIEKILGIDKEKQKRLETNNKLLSDEIDLMKLSYDKGLLDEEGKKRLVTSMEKYREGLLKTNDGLDKNTKKYADNKNEIKRVEDNLKTLTGKNYETKVDVNVDTSKAKTGLQKFFSGLGSTLLNLIIPGFSLGEALSKIAKLDTGTNYVPNDQVAMIHKGEAVIPKKFNSKDYLGKGNDDTNNLLRELIDRVEQIEINPYTTIQDVGTASVDYINKQNRIMGRGVI